MAPLDLASPKTVPRTKNYDSILYTAEVMTVSRIVQFFPLAPLYFFLIFANKYVKY